MEAIMKRIAMCGIVAAILAMSTVTAGATGPPTLRITHPRHLHDNQTVTVIGTGFVPNSTISLTECRVPPTVPGPIDVADCGLDPGVTLRFTTSDTTGGFTLADYVVHERFVAYDGSTVNCARTICVLSAVNLTTINTDRAEGATRVLRFRRHH